MFDSHIMEIARLNAMLHVALGPDLAGNWWLTPNAAFDDRLPKHIYDRDPNGKQKICDYIGALQMNGHEQSN